MANSNKESKIMSVVNAAGNAIMMNLLFLIACVPVVTIGQAWCGMYGAVRYSIRGESWFQGFKEGFRTRFLRGTIAWILGLLLIGYTGFQTFTIWYYRVDGFIPPLIVSSLGALVAILFQAALIPLNVYIPTGVGRWLQNGITVTFTAPLQTLGTAVIMWLPVVLTMIWPDISFMLIMVFIAAYFSLGAVGCTILMKNTLIRIKQAEQARTESEEADQE